MARLIFISPYLKGGKNAKWLRNRTHYFATREGVVIPKKDADTPPTEKQKAYIQRLTKNLPLCRGLLEYEDYKEHPTRKTAAEFIAQAYEQFVVPMDKRENYIDYVANRPGAQQVGGHGLWDANGPMESLREVEEAVSQHAGNVWTPIVSLRREDAERLGYTDVENWRALVCACVGDIAEAYKIHPDHLEWYAALHTKEKHVHIHMILYSTDPREGYLAVQGIRAVKSAFVTKVYENDRISIYEKQTQYRTRLRENAEERMLELIRAMRSGTLQNERMEQLIEELTQRLPLTKGRRVYGYLPPRLKRIVDEIVDELAKDPRVAEAYKIWQELQEQKCLDYSQKLPGRLPLSQQKEFKTVRNMVIQEVLKLSEQDLEAMYHRQVEEQPVQENPAPIDPDPRPRNDVPVYHEPVQRTSAADGAEEDTGKPPNDTPEQNADVPPDSRVPKRDAVYRSPTLGDSVVQMLHHMGRIFEDNSKADGTLYGLQIDRKRRRELQRKRLAMGHKPDDHEEIMQK